VITKASLASALELGLKRLQWKIIRDKSADGARKSVGP
jgi:hypothetical protein